MSYERGPGFFSFRNVRFHFHYFFYIKNLKKARRLGVQPIRRYSTFCCVAVLPCRALLPLVSFTQYIYSNKEKSILPGVCMYVRTACGIRAVSLDGAWSSSYLQIATLFVHPTNCLDCLFRFILLPCEALTWYSIIVAYVVTCHSQILRLPATTMIAVGLLLFASVCGVGCFIVVASRDRLLRVESIYNVQQDHKTMMFAS